MFLMTTIFLQHSGQLQMHGGMFVATNSRPEMEHLYKHEIVI